MTFKPYKSYNFKEKDPVIDKVRTIVNDEGASYKQISDASGVSTSCLYGWFNGATRRPQHAPLMAVLHALGYDYQIVKTGKVVHLRRRA
jgi:uncharacterized membrane protein YkvA (DUF1232 family)